LTVEEVRVGVVEYLPWNHLCTTLSVQTCGKAVDYLEFPVWSAFIVQEMEL